MDKQVVGPRRWMIDLQLQKGRLGTQHGYRWLVGGAWGSSFLNCFYFSVKWGLRSSAESLEEVLEVCGWRRKYDQVVWEREWTRTWARPAGSTRSHLRLLVMELKWDIWPCGCKWSKSPIPPGLDAVEWV